MPKEQFRGLRQRSAKKSVSDLKIKGRHKTPKAKHSWSSSRKFGKNRYYLETVQPKKPTKKELDSIRNSKNNPRFARVVKQNQAKEGHRFIARSGQVVGKYGIFTKPKPPSKPKKKTTRRKPNAKKKTKRKSKKKT